MEMIDVFLEDAGVFNDLETLNDGEKWKQKAIWRMNN